jgi:hypothetical protein
MPDITPTPESTPPADTAKTKRSRSLINTAQAAELTLAGELASTAAKPAYAATLADEEIDAAFITALRAKIAEAETLVAGAGDKTAAKKTTTGNEEGLKKTLLELIGKVQARAKRKYPKAGDPQRGKYYIGEHLATSRTLLETAAQAIITALASDTLPGMKPADVPALQAALAAYKAVQTTQAGDQSGATTARSQLETKVKEVGELRRQIQYAADAAWPSTKKVNAGVRTEFKLSPDRAFK